MLEELKKLAETLPDGEHKTKVLAEITRLEGENLISKPKSLSELLKSDADLMNQHNSIVGELRNKWDYDLKSKEELEKQQKAILDKTAPEEKNQLEGIQKLIEATLKPIQEKIDKFSNTMKTEDLKKFATEKANILPEQLRGLVIVSKDSTEESINDQITKIQEAHKEYMKTVDQKPPEGSGTVELTDTEFEKSLSDFGQGLEDKNTDK